MADKGLRKISVVEYGEYKGNPTISIPTNVKDGEGYAFTFGVAKAKAIVANFKEIEFFANGGGAKIEGDEPF